jgi:hypothetical protein
MAKAGSQSPVNGAGGRRTRVPRPEDLGYRKGKRSHKSQAALEVPDLIAPLTIRLGGALKSWTGESMRSSILCGVWRGFTSQKWSPIFNCTPRRPLHHPARTFRQAGCVVRKLPISFQFERLAGTHRG